MKDETEERAALFAKRDGAKDSESRFPTVVDFTVEEVAARPMAVHFTVEEVAARPMAVRFNVQEVAIFSGASPFRVRRCGPE